MRFNSVTGRAALSAKGGHAAAITHRANGWKHQLRIGRISALVRTRQRMSRQTALLDADYRRIYGCSLLEYLASQSHQNIDKHS